MNWFSIFENLIAGGLIALIFGVFLKRFLENYRKPKLTMVIDLQEPKQGELHWITIAIRNDGKSAFKKQEVSWHLYWPNSFLPHYVSVDDRGRPLPDNGERPYQILGASNIDKKLYWHLSGSNLATILPQMETQIIIFKIDEPYENYKDHVRYHFSTILGIEPNRTWTWLGLKKIKDKNGFPRLNLLPYIKIRDIRESQYKNESFVTSAKIPPDKF